MATAKKDSKTKNETKTTPNPKVKETTEIHEDLGSDLSLENMIGMFNSLNEYMSQPVNEGDAVDPTMVFIGTVTQTLMDSSRYMSALADKTEAEAQIAKIKAEFLRLNWEKGDVPLFQEKTVMGL